MFETCCKNKGCLFKKVGLEVFISVGEEKCKSQDKKKKIIKSSLELLVKEKDVTKLVRMKQRLNMNI